MARNKRRSRRPRGTGSHFFDAARGVWVSRVIVGRYTSGKPKYAEVSDAEQAECLRKAAQVAPPSPSVTVADWAARWHAAHPGRPATRGAYASGIRKWIDPVLGHFRVRDITPSRVEGLAKAMAAADLKANTVVSVLACLRALLGAAVRDGVIDRNPASVARKPKRGKKQINPFSPAELLRIIGAASASVDPRGRLPPLSLMAAVGCRIGEALALDVADFDPAAGTVSITKTIGKYGVGPPKSANGVRTIRVPAEAVGALVAARGKRTAGPLFAGVRNRRLEAADVRAAFGKLLDGLGLARRVPHELRHSVATAMVSAGVPLGDIAKFLGDSVQMIVATYLHPTGADPAATMERLFRGG